MKKSRRLTSFRLSSFKKQQTALVNTNQHHMLAMPDSLSADAICPCGTGAIYGDCCQPLIVGEKFAVSPVMLMRSRYTAFYLNACDYLKATWHAAYCPADVSRHALMRFIKLTVLRHEQQLTTGVVEFVAQYIYNGVAGQLHEMSDFVFEDGRWLYTTGTLLEE